MIDYFQFGNCYNGQLCQRFYKRSYKIDRFPNLEEIKIMLNLTSFLR